MKIVCFRSGLNNLESESLKNRVTEIGTIN